MSYFENFRNTHFVTWVRIAADPHARWRGFSILDREFRALGYNPVEKEMVALDGKKQVGMFWLVHEREFYRVCPEMLKIQHPQNEVWVLPVEFCQPFVRPNYVGGEAAPKGLILPS